jgi:uncharacterized repeat protein (TIGR01451 family)
MKHVVIVMGLALMLCLASAQDEVSIRFEAYIVSEVTTDDGGTQEKFTAATTARPGQIVEYRVYAENVSDVTLPPGSIVLTGPIPENTSYVDGSARTNASDVLTEFSTDGSNFGQEPLVTTIEEEDGNTRQGIALPENYSAVRWTLRLDLEPGQEEIFYYRVILN